MKCLTLIIYNLQNHQSDPSSPINPLIALQYNFSCWEFLMTMILLPSHPLNYIICSLLNGVWHSQLEWWWRWSGEEKKWRNEIKSRTSFLCERRVSSSLIKYLELENFWNFRARNYFVVVCAMRNWSAALRVRSQRNFDA